ncbi:MAG: hypothetical protein WCK10_04225 [Candidatus Staskawiczbacteria bacterium]
MKRLLVILFITCMIIFSVSSANAGSKTLTFAWEQVLPSPNNLVGWKLYIANTAGGTATLLATIPFVSVAASYTTTQTITVPDGVITTRYFKILAYNSTGLESDFSNEISTTINLTVPGIPTNLRITIN